MREEKQCILIPMYVAELRDSSQEVRKIFGINFRKVLMEREKDGLTQSLKTEIFSSLLNKTSPFYHEILGAFILFFFFFSLFFNSFSLSFFFWLHLIFKYLGGIEEYKRGEKLKFSKLMQGWHTEDKYFVELILVVDAEIRNEFQHTNILGEARKHF